MMNNLSPEKREEEILEAIHSIRDYYEFKFIDKGISLYDAIEFYLKNNTIVYHIVPRTLDWDDSGLMGVFSLVYRIKDSPNICHCIVPWLCVWENFLGWDGEYGR